MNFYNYIGASKEAVAMDATVSEMKAPSSETALKRLRIRKDLADYVSRNEALRIINEGTALITTITGDRDHGRIAKYVYEVFKGTKDKDDLIRYLIRTYKVEEDRAELIANDQISKATVRFQVEKWKKQGCKLVRWVHIGEPNPRDYHKRTWNGRSGKRNGMPNGLNGFVFSIDKPPVINRKTKERGYPGQAINCRCRLEPVR